MSAVDGQAARRVVVADDDALLREGLVSLLGRSGFDVVGQAGDGPALLALVRHTAWRRRETLVVAVASRSLVRRAANPVPRLVAMLITAGRANFIDSAMKSAMAQSLVGVAVVVPWFERRL